MRFLFFFATDVTNTPPSSVLIMQRASCHCAVSLLACFLRSQDSNQGQFHCCFFFLFSLLCSSGGGDDITSWSCRRGWDVKMLSLNLCCHTKIRMTSNFWNVSGMFLPRLLLLLIPLPLCLFAPPSVLWLLGINSPLFWSPSQKVDLLKLKF